MRRIVFLILAMAPIWCGAQEWQRQHVEADELLDIQAHDVLRIELEEVYVSINLLDKFFTFELKDGTFEIDGNHLFQWAWPTVGIYSSDGKLLAKHERVPFVTGNNNRWCRTYQWNGKSKKTSTQMYKNLADGGYVRVVFTKFGGYRLDVTIPTIVEPMVIE